MTAYLASAHVTIKCFSKASAQTRQRSLMLSRMRACGLGIATVVLRGSAIEMGVV